MCLTPIVLSVSEASGVREHVLQGDSLFISQKRPWDAIPHYRAALELQPDHPFARHQLTAAYVSTAAQSLLTGNLEDAIGSCISGLEISPKHSGLRLVLADAYKSTGKPAMALVEYGRVLQQMTAILRAPSNRTVQQVYAERREVKQRARGAYVGAIKTALQTHSYRQAFDYVVALLGFSVGIPNNHGLRTVPPI